ncbi:MAG: outer membrane protein assembly factor BamA [Elusimicrobiaceae bacterium]|nr:outer membrane protein assembly factor BamA [Elusimicrobiaceae bacterium]
MHSVLIFAFLLCCCGPVRAQNAETAKSAAISPAQQNFQKSDTLQTDPAAETSLMDEITSGVPVSTVSRTGVEAVEAEISSSVVTATGTPAELELDQNGPWMVCQTAASGLINVKESTILKNAKAAKGEFYQRFFIGEDIQALIGLGSLEKVSVDIARIAGERTAADKSGPFPCHKVTYMAAEKPLIEDIVLQGRDELSKSKVLDAMSLKKKDFFSQGKLLQDAAAIEAKYAEEGFISAHAEGSTAPGHKTNSVILTMNIKEGPETRIGDVLFFGLSGFGKKKILKQTENRPGKVFSEKDLQKDQAEIQQFYKNHGFQEFAITGSSVVFNQDKSEAVLVYHFYEGPKSSFGDTVFSGNTVFTDTELRKALVYVKGRVYKQDLFNDSLRAIQELYADKGYLRAQVKPVIDYNSRTETSNISLEIIENSIVYVGSVDVEGNESTKKYVLTREVTLRPGDVFQANKVRKSQQKMMNLGFLDDVQIDIAPAPEPDKVDLTFDVVEGKPGMMTAGAAVSSVDGLYGELSVQHMNLFGKAQRLALTWSFGTRIMDYSLSWTTPWVDNKPVSLGLDAFNTRRLRPYGSSSTAYREKSTGGRVRVAPRFSDDKYTLSLGYTCENITIDQIDDAYTNVLAPGTSMTSSLTTEFIIDTRDYIWDPTSGSKNSISFELAGGPLMGDIDIYKVTLGSSYNYKLLEISDYPIVWSVANRIGFVDHYANTDAVPVYNRYFLGGQDTIRGYDNNGQIGPSDGGNLYYVLNSEIRFPLARERRKTLVQGAFFFDIGNDWKNFSDVSLETGSGTNQLKMGAGFGIRFTTPSFPIRLDWGYGFNHKSTDSKSEFYFTIGNMF